MFIRGNALLISLNLQDESPTLASLVGSLCLEGTSSMQTAARTALHEEEWPKLRPPPQLSATASLSWVPQPDTVDSLPTEALLEVAVPLDTRQFSSFLLACMVFSIFYLPEIFSGVFHC